ncbi:MAG: hypothetical protein J6Y01_00650 [Spirochaetales bacterium]|nr:hypothetical protein [Spirochaetales bacterium]
MKKGGLKLFNDLSVDTIQSGISIIANIATTLSGIATFIMLLIALFGNRIKKFFHGSKLSLSFKPEFPYCNRTFVINTNQQTFSVKVKIRNNGEMDARNVQVYLNGIYKINENGEYIKSKNVFPMNLMWAFQDKIRDKTPVASVISPDMDKFCDFLFVDRYHCYLRTEVSVPVGNTLCNTIEKGSYKAVIHIMSSESKSIKYNIFFDYTGKWSKNIKKVIQNVHCIRK